MTFITFNNNFSIGVTLSKPKKKKKKQAYETSHNSQL